MMKMNIKINMAVFVGIYFISPSYYCARILGLFNMEAISHYRFQESIMESLLDAGHHVTVLAPFKSKLDHQNLSEIYVKVERKDSPFALLADPKISWFSCSMAAIDIVEEDCRHYSKLAEKVEDIEMVDVIFIEMTFLWRCYMPLARKIGAPVIGTSPVISFPVADPSVGISRLPSISPAEGHYVEPKMNFYERVWKFLYEIEANTLIHSDRYRTQKLYEELFPGEDMDASKVSLLFVNNHASLMPRLLVRNAINIGGLNIKISKLNSLPRHLKSFLDDAENGVILFSLGSLTAADVLSSNVKAIIIQTFRKIPQRVIWKFNDKIDGLPNNVLLSEWLPQKEILAHKNVVAFISHGGINSLYESIYFGKPLVIIPVFGDQPANAALLKSLEVAEYLNIEEVTEEKLTAALNEVINGTRCRERMEKLSQRFRDDPMSPADLVVYWTEYVIKHKGAQHLRFSGADVSLHQYFLIDVIIFTVITFIFVVVVIYLINFTLIVKNFSSGMRFRFFGQQMVTELEDMVAELKNDFYDNMEDVLSKFNDEPG